MIPEILLGLSIAILLLYLFYLYLEWCSQYSPMMSLYQNASTKAMVLSADRAVLDKYGQFLMPEYLADTYKPIRFWILYYTARAST